MLILATTLPPLEASIWKLSSQRSEPIGRSAANRSDVIAVLRRLGFRDAPRVSGFNHSGRHLRQDAVGQR